ncbi:MAG: c-type cytochrome [Candidatus Sericytochromatia bacterium]
MKPADQIKVLVLSFSTILGMIVIITIISLITTKSVAGHGEGGEHGSEVSEHGSESKMAEHGSESKMADSKMAEHGTEGKMADSKMAEHGTEGKMADSKMAEHGTEGKMADSKMADSKMAAGGNAEAGATVFKTKTCVTCHTVSKLPEAKGTIGPKLDGLSKTAATRKPGMSAEAYIKESVENPTAFVAPGFQPAMPPLRTSMNDQEFKDLVAFLGSL